MVLQLEHITKFYTYDKNKQIVINDFTIKFPKDWNGSNYR